MPMPDDSSAEESRYDTPPIAPPFQPLEPEPVQPTSRPAPSEPFEAPGTVGGTSGEDGEAAGAPGEAQAEEQEQKGEELPQFDPQYRKPFEGLLFLGKLKDRFSLWGHDFVIRTLTTEEIAEIGLFIEKYEGTRARHAVYQTAVVACSVVSVDGKPLPQPLGPESQLQAAYSFVSTKWMPPVREAIYNKTFELELRVRQVLEQMGNASG